MNKLLYDHQWMNLYEDAQAEAFVEMSDDAVTIVAITLDHKVLFVREKSIAYQTPMLSLPMGGVEEGELPSVAANRELREEVGYKANDLEYVGTLHPSAKYMRWECHVFLARDLVVSPLPADETSPVAVQPMAIRAVNRYIGSGQLSDSTAIAALHLVWRHLKSQARAKPVVIPAANGFMNRRA